jgi:sugar lactone lactonase YvrE
VGADGTVSFDRAFGVDVDPSDGNTGDFENCTTTCTHGTQNGSAGGLTDSAGVEVDAQGRILVADFFNKRIDRFTVENDGSVAFDLAFGGNVDPNDGDTGLESCTAVCQTGTATDGAGGLDTPNGIAVDGQGRILVTDSSYRRVSRFAVSGVGSVSFDRAFGVGVDPSGSTTAFENCTTSCQQGSPSGAAGGLSAPGGIDVDSQGRILVTDSNVYRVDRFAVDADGTVELDRAFGIDVDPSNSNTGFENCTATCKSGSPSPAAGGVIPLGIAVDAVGRIVVGDNHDRISIFRPPQVTVQAALAPAGDGGRFDLRVNGVVVNSGVGDGGSARKIFESTDPVTVGEQAAAGTSLSDYDTTIDCGDGPHAGTSLTIPALTADVTCTIANTHKPTPAGPGGDSGGGGSSGTPGGGSPGGTQPGGPLPDTSRPALGSIGLTNKVFAVDTHGTAETAVAARAKRGTVLRYKLTEKARVVVAIERATVGRKVGRSCRKPTKANRKRKACTLYVSSGNFAVQSAAGQDSHAFSGRIGRKSLAPGTYRASLVAIDAAGNRSVARRISFRIVKR